jgi:hypothetical protein
LFELKRILIIELKRGGSTITRDNLTQMMNYIQDLLSLSELPENIFINAYIVGHSIAKNLITSHTVGEKNKANISITTFSQLVSSADRRLFNLRHKIQDHYDKYSENEYSIDAINRSLY